MASLHLWVDVMAKSNVEDMSVQLDQLIQSVYSSFKLQANFAGSELGIFDALSSGESNGRRTVRKTVHKSDGNHAVARCVGFIGAVGKNIVKKSLPVTPTHKLLKGSW